MDHGGAYTPSLGIALGATKTSGAEGVHHLARSRSSVSADAATTAGYVRSLGHRPASPARRAAELLDPTRDAAEVETG